MPYQKDTHVSRSVKRFRSRFRLADGALILFLLIALPLVTSVALKQTQTRQKAGSQIIVNGDFESSGIPVSYRLESGTCPVKATASQSQGEYAYLNESVLGTDTAKIAPAGEPEPLARCGTEAQLKANASYYCYSGSGCDATPLSGYYARHDTATGIKLCSDQGIANAVCCNIKKGVTYPAGSFGTGLDTKRTSQAPADPPASPAVAPQPPEDAGIAPQTVGGDPRLCTLGEVGTGWNRIGHDSDKRGQSRYEKYTLVSSPVKSGSKAQQIEVDTSGYGVHQVIPAKKDKRYKLSFSVYVRQGSAEVRVGEGDLVRIESFTKVNQWETKEIQFIPKTDGLRITIQSLSRAQFAVDSITAEEISNSATPPTHREIDREPFDMTTRERAQKIANPPVKGPAYAGFPSAPQEQITPVIVVPRNLSMSLAQQMIPDVSNAVQNVARQYQSESSMKMIINQTQVKMINIEFPQVCFFIGEFDRAAHPQCREAMAAYDAQVQSLGMSLKTDKMLPLLFPIGFTSPEYWGVYHREGYIVVVSTMTPGVERFGEINLPVQTKYNVIIHEIGHALGLTHSTLPSIMAYADESLRVLLNTTEYPEKYVTCHSSFNSESGSWKLLYCLNYNPGLGSSGSGTITFRGSVTCLDGSVYGRALPPGEKIDIVGWHNSQDATNFTLDENGAFNFSHSFDLSDTYYNFTAFGIKSRNFDFNKEANGKIYMCYEYGADCQSVENPVKLAILSNDKCTVQTTAPIKVKATCQGGPFADPEFYQVNFDKLNKATSQWTGIRYFLNANQEYDLGIVPFDTGTYKYQLRFNYGVTPTAGLVDKTDRIIYLNFIGTNKIRYIPAESPTEAVTLDKGQTYNYSFQDCGKHYIQPYDLASEVHGSVTCGDSYAGPVSVAVKEYPSSAPSGDFAVVANTKINQVARDFHIPKFNLRDGKFYRLEFTVFQSDGVTKMNSTDYAFKFFDPNNTIRASGNKKIYAHPHHIDETIPNCNCVSIGGGRAPAGVCPITQVNISSFTATPATVTSGGSSTLSWTSNGSSCEITGLGGIKYLSLPGTGSKIETNITVARGYLLTCKYGLFTNTATATVTVNGAPPPPPPPPPPATSSISGSVTCQFDGNQLEGKRIVLTRADGQQWQSGTLGSLPNPNPSGQTASYSITLPSGVNLFDGNLYNLRPNAQSGNCGMGFCPNGGGTYECIGKDPANPSQLRAKRGGSSPCNATSLQPGERWETFNPASVSFTSTSCSATPSTSGGGDTGCEKGINTIGYFNTDGAGNPLPATRVRVVNDVLQICVSGEVREKTDGFRLYLNRPVEYKYRDEARTRAVADNPDVVMGGPDIIARDGGSYCTQPTDTTAGGESLLGIPLSRLRTGSNEINIFPSASPGSPGQKTSCTVKVMYNKSTGGGPPPPACSDARIVSVDQQKIVQRSSIYPGGSIKVNWNIAGTDTHGYELRLERSVNGVLDTLNGYSFYGTIASLPREQNDWPTPSFPADSTIQYKLKLSRVDGGALCDPVSGERLSASQDVYDPRGVIEGRSLTSCSLVGWALDADRYNDPIDVHVYLDAPWSLQGKQNGTLKMVGIGTANKPRNDTYNGHGFVVPLDARAQDGLTHKVYVYGINKSPSKGTNVLLTNSGTMEIRCASSQGLIPQSIREVANGIQGRIMSIIR